jgi:hypothetical protein
MGLLSLGGPGLAAFASAAATIAELELAGAEFSTETGLGSFVSSDMVISSLGTATPLQVPVVAVEGCPILVRESLGHVMSVTLVRRTATFAGG